MRIDLHIHTSTGSDGILSVEEVFREARERNINFMSITDHDSVDCQERAISLAAEYGIDYISGVELNVTFQYNGGIKGDKSHHGEPKSVSLDFLGYQYDIDNQELRQKLELLRKHRRTRAHRILEKLNTEFARENIEPFTGEDIKKIEDSVDGAFGRPHIAGYLVEKGIVSSIQEAFDKYLVRCNVPKLPLSLAEASSLVRNAGGKLVLAHPNDPNRTSLVSLTSDLSRQARIIEESVLEYIDGIECWHSRNDAGTTASYIELARKHGLLMTGGSDCHQRPLLMGTLDIPDYVAAQFRR
ncbi:MAG: PHP domain-containing protein [Dehalococcoidales bacterium]|nr:PHP domain-containing protein [Dehalococcoidales bacterium]